MTDVAVCGLKRSPADYVGRCRNVRPGEAYTFAQCRLCWKFDHVQSYRDRVSGGTAGRARSTPGSVVATRPGRFSLDCSLRGDPTGEIRSCTTCGGPKDIPLYACQVHGSCSAEGPRLDGVAWCRTCSDKKPRGRQSVLIEFPHGLGDCCQLTSILRHLRKHKPDWDVDVRVRYGCESLFHGLCRKAYHYYETPKGPYDLTVSDGFPEAQSETKTTRSLRSTYGLTPEVELMGYEVRLRESDLRSAAVYYESLGLIPWPGDRRFNAIVVHYKGNSAACRKNLPDAAILPLADRCLSLGLKLVVLDFDDRTEACVRDHPAVAMCTPQSAPDLWLGRGCGDAARVAALIELATAWLGIDSGPGHVGGACTTPGVVVWTHHHPVRFYDWGMRHVLHLVPEDLDRLAPRRGGRAALDRYYRYRPYRDMGDEIAMSVLENLAHREPPSGAASDAPPVEGAAFRWGFWVPGDRPAQSWTIIEDVLIRDAYKTRLRPRATGVEYVVDVGANIGAFSRLWSERNPEAVIACIEVHPALTPLLRANVPGALVIEAACTYRTEPLYILDSISAVEVSKSTGGTRIVGRSEWDAEQSTEYVKRPGPALTLPLEALGFPRIDVLKLDVEGSELYILEHCDLSRIGTIFVESHDPARWRDLLGRRFQGWDIGHMSANGPCETWHLVNPIWPPQVA